MAGCSYGCLVGSLCVCVLLGVGVLTDVLLVFCVVVCSVMWLGVLIGPVLLVLCVVVFCYVDGCSDGCLVGPVWLCVLLCGWVFWWFSRDPLFRCIIYCKSS